jgi:hypothetical protein
MQPKTHATHPLLPCRSHKSRPVRRLLPWVRGRLGGYVLRRRLHRLRLRLHRRRGPVESPRRCGELGGRDVVDEGAVEDPRRALRAHGREGARRARA